MHKNPYHQNNPNSFHIQLPVTISMTPMQYVQEETVKAQRTKAAYGGAWLYSPKLQQ